MLPSGIAACIVAIIVAIVVVVVLVLAIRVSLFLVVVLVATFGLLNKLVPVWANQPNTAADG